MKLICQKNQLLEAVGTVIKATSSKSNREILEGIMITCNDNLVLTANNMEIAIEASIEADIKEKGAVVVNGRLFYEIIRKLPNDEVNITTNNNLRTEIVSGHAIFTLSGFDPDEFPEISKVEKEDMFSINQEVFRNMISNTIYAVAIEEEKKILNGCLLDYKENILNMVAVDGYRMAIRKCELDKEYNTFKFVVPGKTLNELSKILLYDEDNVNIYHSKNMILFEFNNYIMTSRMLEGEFIDYNKIIPTDHITKITIETKEMIQAIERAALVNTNEKIKYPLILQLETDKIIINCNTSQGNVHDEIDCETFGEDIKIGFNHRYILEALKASDSEKIEMFFNSPLNPCIIKGFEEDEYINFVLPIRLSE